MAIKKLLENLNVNVKTPFVDIGWQSKDKIIVVNMANAWEHASGGNIPEKAAIAGHEASGEALYIARAKYENGIHIGKVRPGYGGACIPWGGKEIEINPYEVFVGVCRWRSTSKNTIPMGAIVAGNEGDGTPLYVARAEYERGVHIGKVRPGFGGACIPLGGKEIIVINYEVLVAE